MYILQESYIDATFIKLKLNFNILFPKLVIVMAMDQMVLSVTLMVYAVVKLILSMTNVIHVKMVSLTFLPVKVNNTMGLELSLN